MNENVKVAFYGFAVGDAMGVPYEFKKRGTFVCENMRASTFLDSHFPLPLGSWSDDTSLMLCVADALIEKIKYEKQEKPPMTGEQLEKHNEKLRQKVYRKFKWNAIGWLLCGKYTNHGYIIPYDVGNSCRRGILSMLLNVKNRSASMESSNGNGGLMRVLPLAFLKYDTNDELFEYIKLFNHCSHNHNISHIGCLIYIKIIQNLFTEQTVQDALLKTIKELDNKYKIPEYHSFWDASIIKKTKEEIKSTGYVVDTLEAVVWSCLQSQNYKDTVLCAVNLGGDTDTIAALSGAIAGVQYRDIPDEWIKNIRNKYLIEKICEKI